MTRKRQTSDDGEPPGPETDAADGIPDAEVVGEDTPAPVRSPEAADGTDRRDIGDERPEAGPAEETAPEAAPEIGRGEDPREPEAEPARHDDAAETGPAEEGRLPDEVRAEDAEEPARRDAPAPDRSSDVPTPAPRRGAGGFVVALLLGAVLAALAGVGAARFVFPDGWPGQGDTAAELAALRADMEAQGGRLAGLETSFGNLEASLGDLEARIAALPDPAVAAEGLRADLTARIDAAASAASDAAARLDALEQGLSGLDARLAELAQRPVPEALDTASLDAELSEFRAELSAAVEAARGEMLRAQEDAAAIAAEAEAQAAAREEAAAAEAEALRAEAEAAAAASAREAAVSRIRAAIENGEPYADDLAALGGDVPEALAAPAAEGVPSLAALAESFPPAARQALDASIRATMGDGALDRVAAFLRVQTGARSLEPRAGDDPDAVLSRAEAALRAGELDAALSELTALPEAGQAAMAGWIDAARTRHEAAAAARALTPN